MEEIGPLWGYESESSKDLKQKLLHATLELESANKYKMELFDLLITVCRERDELQEELTKVLQKLTPTPSLNVPNDNVIPQVITETRIRAPNTSVTESNNLSHDTSAADSFLDVVSSPDFSNDSQNMGFLNSERQHKVILLITM